MDDQHNTRVMRSVPGSVNMRSSYDQLTDVYWKQSSSKLFLQNGLVDLPKIIKIASVQKVDVNSALYTYVDSKSFEQFCIVLQRADVFGPLYLMQH